MTTYVYCTRPSKGARVLASALGATRSRTLPSARSGDTIINWGCGLAVMNGVKVINPAPLYCSDKIVAFNKMKEAHVSIPEYTTDRNAVTRDHTWLARSTVTGHGGAGITIISPGDPVPNAPLYVKYIPKIFEVRVHVANGRPFDFQQKMRRGEGTCHPHVWSHSNNYVFVRNSLSIPVLYRDRCEVEALKAVAALDMDFGAVDVVHDGTTAYVLEVNSAPGLEGTTLLNYVQMFRRMIDGS